MKDTLGYQSPPRPEASLPRPVIQPPRAGDVLGRFVLEQPLGHGGMATVFRARDTALARQVAIKVLNPAVACQPSSAERFRREAMAAAGLRHPGIVEVYDFFPAADGHSAYLVEELIEGDTLQALLDERRGGFIPELAALLVAEVADALEAAHQRGVVHRDVKPANIMIERQEQAARIVLTDFGVAHVQELATMTATGAMVGSPAHMAPEQARGQGVGPQVDVWALGVLLYQLSTGSLPFSGRDPITVISAICKGEYKRAAQIDARVGGPIDRIINGCLKASAADRIASAAAVATMLRECAAAAGLTHAGPVLRRWLDQPEALEAELKPRLVQEAITNARQFMRKRQLSRALSELGKATAYQPKHPEALRLIESLSTRRRWGRVLAVAAAVVAVSGAAAAASRIWRTTARTSTLATRVNTEAPSSTKSLVEPAPTPVEAPTLVPAAPVQPDPASSLPSPQPPRLKRPPRHVRGRMSPEAAPATAASSPPPPPIVAIPQSGAQEPAAQEPAPVAPPALEAQPARVRLLARFAFCFPSLDEDPARKPPPRSYEVIAGQHEVYCSLTASGPRLHAGSLQVAPGHRVEVNIVPDEHGRPKLSRTR